MSLHNFNPNNKSWKMYSNTITSISGDNLTIKPYDGKNLLLEVSGNNNIFFKRGNISYGLEDLIGANITLTSVSGDIIPSNDNTFKLGDVSKNWSNAYIRDLSVSNISVSGNIFIPSNSINSSHIINGSILTEDICNNTITRNKLSELTTNLMIFNSDTSTTTLEYTITLNTAGTITTYFNYPWGGIGIGMIHSVRVCIPSITTQISVLIDTDGKSVSANEVFNGAIQVGTFTDNTLTFTFDPDGYDNIQIGFVIEDSVPPANTGFWGTFVVQNVTTATHRYMDVYLAYNDVPITSTERIHGDNNYTFNIPEEDRLPLPSSILQLKITMQQDTESVDIDVSDGFSIESIIADEESTLGMLINENNYDDGQCSVTFNVTYDPP